MTDGVGVGVGVGVFVGVGVGVGVFVGVGVGVGIGVFVGVGVGKNGNESPLQASAGKVTSRHTNSSLMRFISTPPCVLQHPSLSTGNLRL
jgi:hypothetical protein